MLSGLFKIGKYASKAALDTELDQIGRQAIAAEQSIRASKMDMLHSYWANGLLSRPATHVRNTTANTATALLRPFETAAAAGWNAVERVIDPAKDTIFLQEAAAEVVGGIQGLTDAFKLLRHFDPKVHTEKAKELGIDPTLYKSTKWDEMNKSTSNDSFADITWGFLGKYITAPGQALQHMDNFFKTIHYRANVRKMLTRQALKKKQLDPMFDVDGFIETRMDSPDEIIRLSSIADAEVRTFTDKWKTEFSQSLDAALGNKGFRWLFPFRKAPAKILGYSIDRTPVALLKPGTYTGGAIERSTAVGQVVAGSAFALSIFSLTMDILDGRAPLDPLQRNMWEEAGHRQYSMRLGGEHIPLDSFGPVGVLLKVMTDYGYMINNFDVTTDDGGWQFLWDAGTFMVQPWASALQDNTFLRTAGGLIKAVDDSRRYQDPVYIQRQASRMAGSFVWSAFADMAKRVDTNMRNPQSPFDAILTRIPGMADSVPIRYNVFGEPVQYHNFLGPENNNPFLGQNKEDELVKTLDSWGFSKEVPRLIRSIDGVKLTPKEYEAYQKLAGQGIDGMPTLRDSISKAVDQLANEDVPMEYKYAALKNIISEYRKIARQVMLTDPKFNIQERKLVLQQELNI